MAQPNKPPFDIVICGAGIAGLCAGTGLAQQGHNVTILESAHELTPVGIGIHLPPNATRVLGHYGLLERMSKDAMNPPGFSFRRWTDNKTITGTSSSPPKASAPSDAPPYWTMRRSDYQRHLLQAAVEAGCDVRLNSRVISLDVDVPAVTLEGGRTITGDLIVVADGIKSKLREFIIPEERVLIAANYLSSYRGFVNVSDLNSDPVTAPFFEGDFQNIWAGPNRHVIAYSCGGGLCTLGAMFPADDLEIMAWNQPATSDQARQEFKGWSNPVIDHMFSYAQDLKQWRLAEVLRLPRWTSESGKATLIGDSAHAMSPFLAQGAAMATEDSAALVECIGRASSPKDIPPLTKAYERSRKWRCEIVSAQSRRSGEMLHIPDGEEQENRDSKMAGGSFSDFWDVDVGPLIDPKFRAFMYGHDVVEHTRKTLRDMSS